VTARRTAFVTGGTSGIGRAIVARLASDGHLVAFTGRDADRGAEVAAANGAAFVPTEAADRTADDAAFETGLSYLGGRIDIFVANAAAVYRGALTEMTEAALTELLEINLTSPFRLSRACFEAMAAQRQGVIIHIASDSALRGIHTLPAYSMTKSALRRLSTVLAAEGGPVGVRVNVVCPGATPPGMKSTLSGYEKHGEDSRGWVSPATRGAPSADDVAGVVAWLASDEAARVSGVAIAVDGGASATIDAGRLREDA
jgi:meso-butanediol dehydrogenase / (S,S)-butanediol dehydrogenase / diacetyl reductase